MFDNYANYQSLSSNPSPVFLCFSFRQSGKRSLVPDAQNQWIDFKNLNGIWKLKRFYITCIELILNLCLGNFCFQFDFLFNFDFQMHKTNLKALFLIFCLLEIIIRPFISSMAKFKLYNIFSLAFRN